MNLKVYYQKIREIEEGLQEAAVVVVSIETPDGGKAGVFSEVSKRVAATMVVEAHARLATPEESHEFRERTREAQRTAEQVLAAGRMQVTVLPTSELRYLRGARTPKE
jgi:hypothetical protein